MTHVGYIVAAYIITFGVLAGYAAWLSLRTRAVARVLHLQAQTPDPPPGPDR